ncbi:MAG: heavy metal translocating P-type ATPase [Gemmatimonadaceae bacterium]
MASADHALPSVRQETTARAQLACAHCGLDVPPGFVVADAERQFCCGGCQTAFSILHEHGLDAYYAFPERREAPVRRSGRGYAEFDHPAFQALHVQPGTNGLARVELYLEGVHCASCVWLVERVPLLIPGVARAELQVRRSLAAIEWDAASVPLSRIAETLDSLGYPPHPFRGLQREQVRRAEDRAALVRIGVAGAIAINVMLAAVALYSGVVSGMESTYAHFFRWVSLLVAIPALLGPGRVFFAGAWGALRTRTLHMDLPIAIGLAAGFIRGTLNTVSGSGPIYFDGLCTLIFVLLVGRFLQQRGQRRAADSAELLYSLTPHTARVVAADGALQDVPSEALLPGMVLDVRAGETLAADGEVVGGVSALNMSLLTGESRPVSVREGDRVFAGTLNVTSALRVRVDSAGESSRVAQLIRQVEQSAERKARVVLLADRLSGAFVVVVLLLALGIYAYWVRRDASRAIDNAIALLIVTCPCALAMATPLAVTVAVGRAARAGLLIKGGDALELLAKSGTIFLDKTGTVTRGESSLLVWDGPDWVKPLVLALERESSHPVADGFRRAWAGLDAPEVAESAHVAGGGIRGVVEGRRLTVGSPAFVSTDLASPPSIDEAVALTPVWIAIEGSLVARAGFGDPVRPDARAAVDALRSRGWKTQLLSGDAKAVVDDVARQLGIPLELARAGATPEEKARAVDVARATGPVVMVGDGVNDAAAIATASVGIGVHGGAEACLATADVYLVSPGVEPLVRLLDGSRRTMHVIRRNIAFSLAYNVVGAALAMTGTINPLIAAIMMPASSLTVIVASWRSRSFDETAAVPESGASTNFGASLPSHAARSRPL